MPLKRLRSGHDGGYASDRGHSVGQHGALYYAISRGQDVASSVRDPIVKARSALDRGEALSDDQEGIFLDAYAKLALSVAPVTAGTLDATSRERGRRGWLGRLLGLQPLSDAQRMAWRFGLLALCLIAAIVIGEWTHAFMSLMSAADKQLAASLVETREANLRLENTENQIEKLKTGSKVSDTANTDALLQVLEARKNEVQQKLWGLQYADQELIDTINTGYATLGRVFPLGQDRLLSIPLGKIVVSFLLSALYGALGACVFFMRRLFREIGDRSFDGQRTGEFTVRIFLGMLGGVALQWFVARPDGTVVGGITPAALAFLGGYSLELVFTVMDRLIQSVAQPTAHDTPPPGRERPAA